MCVSFTKAINQLHAPYSVFMIILRARPVSLSSHLTQRQRQICLPADNLRRRQIHIPKSGLKNLLGSNFYCQALAPNPQSSFILILYIHILSSKIKTHESSWLSLQMQMSIAGLVRRNTRFAYRPNQKMLREFLCHLWSGGECMGNWDLAIGELRERVLGKPMCT